MDTPVATWSVLGDPILAYALHRIANKWSIIGKSNLTATPHDFGDAGFMNQRDEVDDFDGDLTEVLLEDISKYAKKQYWNLEYQEIEDEEEEWAIAVLDD